MPTAAMPGDIAALAELHSVAEWRCRAQTTVTGTARAWPSASLVPAGTSGDSLPAPVTTTTASPNARSKPGGIVSLTSGTVGFDDVTTASPVHQPGWSGYHVSQTSVTNVRPLRARNCA